MSRPLTLAMRLRTETAALHRRTEEQAGVPGRVSTADDYVELLESMLAFHRSVERELANPRWSSDWIGVGIDIDAHIRSQLIIQDLCALGSEATAIAAAQFVVESFPEALGCLYVVEGSSLGGKFIGPAIVGSLGQVPTAYYDGDGREHPAPWRSLQAGLAAFEARDGNVDAVISGAVDTFILFGDILEARVKAHEPV